MRATWGEAMGDPRAVPGKAAGRAGNRSKDVNAVSGGDEHPRSPAGAPLVRACIEILLWWVFTALVWLATLTSITLIDLAVAVVCTLPCAALARSARHANGGNWGFRVGWLAWGSTVARDVAVQTVQAWLYALTRRRRPAVLTAVPLPAEDEQAAAGRRAVTVLAFATTPGTVVCDCDARTGRVLLHRLGYEQGRLELAAQR